MREQELRVRIPKSLYKKYRMVCIELELSVPKQTTQIIRQFVDTMDRNKEFVKVVK